MLLFLKESTLLLMRYLHCYCLGISGGSRRINCLVLNCDMSMDFRALGWQ